MQTSSSSAPVHVYEANLALCLRVNELMRIGGQKWVEAGTRFYDHTVAASTADYARLTKPGAPTPAVTGEVFWGEIRRWSADLQAARTTALEEQRSLSAGLREAVTTWGTAVNGAFARTDGVVPFNDAWVAALTKWTQPWPVVAIAK